MQHFAATTNIRASADTIWRILTDAASYPTWDPGTIRIEGTIARGQKVVAYNKLNPNRGFSAKVTRFEPGRAMTWSGGMPFGLFTGVRTFTLDPQPDGTVNFTLREEFTGPMLALIGRSLPDMTDSFKNFAAGLKARAENG